MALAQNFLFLLVAIAGSIHLGIGNHTTFRFEVHYETSCELSSTQIFHKKFQKASDFSVATFVKLQAQSKRYTLFSYRVGGDQSQLALAFDNEHNQFILTLGTKTSKLNGDLKADKWYHVGVSRKDGKVNLFVNGESYGAFSDVDDDYSLEEDGKLVVGQYQNGDNSYRKEERFIGRLSEFNYFDQTLEKSHFETLSQGKELQGISATFNWRRHFGQDGLAIVSRSTVPSQCSNTDDSDSDEDKENKCNFVYDMKFDENNDKSVIHVKEADFSKDSTKFSFASWVYVEDADKEQTVFSYYTDKDKSRLVSFIRNGQFLVSWNDKEYKLATDEAQIRNKHWKHFVYQWESGNGQLVLYLDGKKIGYVEGVNKGKKLSGGGKFVLGQRHSEDQEEFEVDKRFQGKLSRVYYFQDTLTDSEVSKISEPNSKFSTNKVAVVCWSKSTFAYSGLSRVTQTNVHKSRDDDGSDSDEDSSSEESCEESSEESSEEHGGKGSGEHGKGSKEHGKGSGEKGKGSHEKNKGSGEHGKGSKEHGKGSGEKGKGSHEKKKGSGEHNSKEGKHRRHIPFNWQKQAAMNKKAYPWGL